MYCACHAKGSRGPSGGHARRSSSRRLCVLRLPRQRAPQLVQEALCTAPATRKAAGAPAAATRAAARPGGSVYCACHAKGSRGPSGGHARRARPGGSVYCACHAKGSRGPSGGHARRSFSRRSCVLRLHPRPQRRPRAPQLVQEALCTAPATRKAAAAPAAATRAAAPPGGPVYCACHAKGSRGPSGGHARRSSSRRLCVLRLPRQRQPRPQRRPRAPQLVQEALCTAPATPKAAAAPAAATRAAARPGGSVYCACHAKGSRGPTATRAAAPLCTAPA